MPNFLFWNVNRKNNDESIVRLVERHDLDILIFAEFEQEPIRLLRRLNEHFRPRFHYISELRCRSIRILTRFSSGFLTTVPTEPDRYTIQAIHLPARQEVLLLAAHLLSKLRMGEVDATSSLVQVARRIGEAEQRAGHRKTILVGDLNANPFEPGMTAANGLHAVMSRQVASKSSRIVDKEEFTFFYNPMWNHFGDRNGTPPGTYYYPKGKHMIYFWNMFDQVVVRPALMNGFPAESIRILTTDGQSSFVRDDGTPDVRVFRSSTNHLLNLLLRELQCQTRTAYGLRISQCRRLNPPLSRFFATRHSRLEKSRITF